MVLLFILFIMPSDISSRWNGVAHDTCTQRSRGRDLGGLHNPNPLLVSISRGTALSGDPLPPHKKLIVPQNGRAMVESLPNTVLGFDIRKFWFFRCVSFKAECGCNFEIFCDGNDYDEHLDDFPPFRFSARSEINKTIKILLN